MRGRARISYKEPYALVLDAVEKGDPVEGCKEEEKVVKATHCEEYFCHSILNGFKEDVNTINNVLKHRIMAKEQM